MCIRDSFNSYTAGQLWYLLDKETELGISKLRMSRLKSLNLNKYDVLLFPGVRGTVDSSLVNKLKTWVLNGGTLIATEGSAQFLTKKSGMNKVKVVEAPKPKMEGIPPSAYTRYEDRSDSLGLKRIPGTAFYGIIDNSHPLAFGVPDRLYTLKQSVSALMPNPSLQTVGYYHKDPMKLKVSGYASVENRKLLAGKTFAAVQPMGRGKIVYLVDNTQYRMFWVGPSRMVQNAVMLLPNM